MQSRRFTHLLWLSILVTLATSCTIGIVSQPTAAPVIQPTAMPQPTMLPPTEVPTITPTKGPVIVDDDFSTDNGRFKCDYCEVRDGALFIGPYPSADSYGGYYALCSDCGEAANYKMSVDTWYVEGPSDRGFGLLLRTLKGGSYIDLEVTTWQVYGIWSYDASLGGSGSAWDTFTNGWVPGSLRPGRANNTVEVIMKTTNGKTSLSVSINGKVNRMVDLPTGSGEVGLIVGMHSLGVAFDNFHFEPLP
jgi:hypothetical protein